MRVLGRRRDRESEGRQHCRIRCRVLRAGDRIGWRSGETFIEVQFDARIPGARKQRVGETLLRVSSRVATRAAIATRNPR